MSCFQLYSDPYADVRYWGKLKIGFPKKSIPTADGLLKTVAEVLTVQPNEPRKKMRRKRRPAEEDRRKCRRWRQSLRLRLRRLPAEAQAPRTTKTISVGQTKEEVMATFGQPQKVVKLQTKEMLYYPDMKVTLVKSRVTDVE